MYIYLLGWLKKATHCPKLDWKCITIVFAAFPRADCLHCAACARCSFKVRIFLPKAVTTCDIPRVPWPCKLGPALSVASCTPTTPCNLLLGPCWLNCEVHIALEWPRKCRYWKLTKVAKLLNFYGMIAYHCDGCALGMVNQDNDPLKKPWAVATNHAGVGKALSKFQCTCNRRHAPGRGIALKKTEEYTFRMTDAIHKALTRQHPALKLTCCALISPFVLPSSSC